MAIDLFCYSSLPVDEVSELLKSCSRQRGDLFSQKFIISPVKEVGDIGKEIAQEHDLGAASYFLIRLNEKSEAHRYSEVSEIIKEVIGRDRVIVLWDNERVI